ncbi:MAG: hypothetical protein PUJ49_00830 [bacterium]|nr:hypothetical protein [bacterium]
MPDALIYIGYILTVAVIVFLSMKLGKYVDVIDIVLCDFFLYFV